MKRIAAVNDISGYGKCSLSVALPVLSCMGFEVCPLPTAVLSTHTGFSNPSIVDFTPYIDSFTEHWKQLGIVFDAVYSGYLASLLQFDSVIRLIEYAKSINPDCFVLIDPVMADNGKLYSTMNIEYAQRFSELSSFADLITPNITEAHYLLGIEYTHASVDDAVDMAQRLFDKFNCPTIITGVVSGGSIYNIVFDGVTHKIFSAPFISNAVSGTGDLFASTVCGYVVSGLNIFDASRKAADFVYHCMIKTRTGSLLAFEQSLGLLSNSDRFIETL